MSDIYSFYEIGKDFLYTELRNPGFYSEIITIVTSRYIGNKLFKTY